MRPPLGGVSARSLSFPSPRFFTPSFEGVLGAIAAGDFVPGGCLVFWSGLGEVRLTLIEGEARSAGGSILDPPFLGVALSDWTRFLDVSAVVGAVCSASCIGWSRNIDFDGVRVTLTGPGVRLEPTVDGGFTSRFG